MTVLPVIVRELRAQARQPLTHSMRVLAMLALIGGGFAFGLGHSFTPNLGGALFAYMHWTLFCAIWILVPVSAADCICRERREGTLGLLFLTPLRPTDIVIAKGVAHGLRAVTLWLSALPVLTIPFLLGGVGWKEAMQSALVTFSSICWALAAALLGSVSSKVWLRALVAAIVLAFAGLLAFAFFTGFLVQPIFTGSMPGRGGSTDFTVLLGLNLLLNAGWNQSFMRVLPAVPVLWAMAQSALISVLALSGAALLAAGGIRRMWREEPPAAWILWCRAKFFQPVVWRGALRRWMRWNLERNPIGWLEQRTWRGRLVVWAWFAIIISSYSVAMTDRMFFRMFNDFQLVLSWLMVGSVATSAAGSFRRERETGVLELLLVSPLTTGQIISGRLRGLWGQFLPAVALLLGIWLYFDSFLRSGNALPKIIFFAETFLLLPVIGLYFSVRCRSFVTAFLLTLVFGVAAPMLMAREETFIWEAFFNVQINTSSSGFWQIAPMMGSFLGQLLLAAFFLFSLHRRLGARKFPLERTIV